MQGDSLVPISPHEEQGKRDVLLGFRSINQDESSDQIEELPPPASSEPTTLGPDTFTDPNSVGRPPSLVGEAIRQRYPDGTVQVLRYVRQDESGNYFNDGPWKLFNPKGQMLAEGTFENGLMQGTWSRWHPANAEGIFRAPPLSSHQGPFLSVASFNRGKLDGVWTIYDRSKRKLFEMTYVDGQRDGAATWWNNEGTIVRQIHFQSGLLEGDAMDYDASQKPVKQTTYVGGRRVYSEVAKHRGGDKKSEDFFLDAKLVLNGDDNWWDAKPAEYTRVGEPVKDGATRAWYENGQLRMEGNFHENQRQGVFRWWYSNGQQQLVGTFQMGRKAGEWTWWHENGMKEVQGSYADDEPVGKWSWWDENGKLVRSGDATTNGEKLPLPSDVETAHPDPPEAEGFEETVPNLSPPQDPG